MDTLPSVSSNGTETEAPHDALDDLVGQNTAALANLRAWRWGACGAGIMAFMALLAVHVLLTRPPPAPLVQYIVRDAAGAFVEDGSPIPMSQYTPADGQWISMLHQYVLRLRERGRDELATYRAWEWLTKHTCGSAGQVFGDYQNAEKPFEHIGQKRREVMHLRVAKTDVPHHYTASWQETYIYGVQQVVNLEQTVVFRVARRPFEAALWPMNPYGLCVAQFGGLKL